MKLSNKATLLEYSVRTLSNLSDMLNDLPKVNLGDLPASRTALVIVDMVNGFAREGALMSPAVENLIPEICRLMRECDKYHITKLAFADNHTEKSPEFEAYPKHCMEGSSEAEIVDEIKEIGGYLLFPKNSTNGFLEDEFQKWLKENKQIDHFVITGDCTDICIQQFAITLKTWFHMQNKKARIIVPVNAVDTYDLGVHNNELMNVMALYNMLINGVEIVSEVK